MQVPIQQEKEKRCKMKKHDVADYLFVDPDDRDASKAALFYKISRKCKRGRRQLARTLIHLWPPSRLDTGTIHRL